MLSAQAAFLVSFGLLLPGMAKFCMKLFLLETLGSSSSAQIPLEIIREIRNTKRPNTGKGGFKGSGGGKRVESH